MKKVIVLSLLAFASSLQASEASHWGYSGHEGPQHWSELDQKNVMCTKGKNQSPINLTHFMQAELPNINLNYLSFANEILNNGHTVQVNYSSGSMLKVNNQEFALKQFHFHSPSENNINGKAYPLEGHFVHMDKNGNLAVIAVMFETGKENRALAELWEKMPNKIGDHHKLSATVTALDLIPNSKDYYEFNGSLTTPPCTEGVLWIVMKQTMTISAEQAEKFKHVMHHPNNRPLQMVGARQILE